MFRIPVINTLIILSLSIPLFLFLGGCGIKPDNLKPPAGIEKNTYPHTYPDLKTDPTPSR